MKSICIFCGSSTGADPAYVAAATVMGRELARRGLRLVYGGGSTGLMGAVANAVLEDGGTAIGVIPENLFSREIVHQGLTELKVASDLRDRKRIMADLADGFVALPGGFGTLEEISEAISWGQLSLHVKPIGLLNTSGYYDHLIGFFDHALDEKFVSGQARAIVRVASSPAELLDGMT